MKRTTIGFRSSVVQQPSDFICAGFLQKRTSSVVARWQRRFFVAAGHYLKYFKDETESHLLAAIDLNSVDVMPLDAVGRGAFFIVLHDVSDAAKQPAPEYIRLKAANEAERNQWVSGLGKLKQLYADTIGVPAQVPPSPFGRTPPSS